MQVRFDKAGLIRRLKALIDNPGSEEEKSVAVSVLSKVLRKYGQVSEITLNLGIKNRRCDRCASAFRDYNLHYRIVCGLQDVLGGFEVTGCYLDGKAPEHCPHKIRALIHLERCEPANRIGGF